MSGATKSSPNKDLKRMDSHTNLFIQWIPPDLLQPIHKFLTRGPFCDPYHQQQQDEDSDSESEIDYDTTTTATVDDNGKTTETDNEERVIEEPSNISTTGAINGEDESHGSAPSVDLSLQEGTHPREVLPMESAISNDPDEEVVLQRGVEELCNISTTINGEDESHVSAPSVDPSLQKSTHQREALPVESALSNDLHEEVELQLSSHDEVEISLDDHQFRSRSFSDIASQEIVDLNDKDVVSNEIPTTPEANLASSDQIPPPCSDARTIVKFLLFWVGLLLVAVILQPGSIYDSKWFLHRFQQTQDTVQKQLVECEAFFGGKVETDCSLEILHDQVKIQVTACRAYIHGETDTSCLVQVAGQAILTQSLVFWTTIQSSHHAIHDTLSLEFSNCQSFLQQHGETPSGCILEPPFNFVHQNKDWIINQAESIVAYSQYQVHACQTYLTGSEEKQNPTGCFMEDAVIEWKNFEQRTTAKFDKTLEQLDRQYVECQLFLAGSTATDCFLERAQLEIHERMGWMTAKISELSTRISQEVSLCGNTFKPTTSVDDVEDVAFSKSETTFQEDEEEEVVTVPTSDQQKDISDPLDDVSTAFGRSSTEMSMASLQNGKDVSNDARHEKQKQFDLSYFDNLQPIPDDQIPPRSAFKVEKRRTSKDTVKSRTTEQDVEHHLPTNEANAATNVGDQIEHNPTTNDKLTGPDQVEDYQENPSPSESPKETNTGVDKVDETTEHASKAKASATDGSSNPISSTTTITKSVVESKDDSEKWTDETDNTEKTTDTATSSEEESTNSLGDGHLLGEMDFVKLEYDANGIPYLVKGVKTMGNIE